MVLNPCLVTFSTSGYNRGNEGMVNKIKGGSKSDTVKFLNHLQLRKEEEEEVEERTAASTSKK